MYQYMDDNLLVYKCNRQNTIHVHMYSIGYVEEMCNNNIEHYNSLKMGKCISKKRKKEYITKSENQKRTSDNSN